MRILAHWSLLAAILLLLGCGGAGGKENGGTALSNVPEEYMASLGAAFQTRNMDFIGQQIADEYYDDCETRPELIAQIQETLGSAGIVEFTAAPITNKSVNNLNGRASFQGGWILKVTESTGSGTIVRELSRSGEIFLRAASGRWQLFGDQEACL